LYFDSDANAGSPASAAFATAVFPVSAMSLEDVLFLIKNFSVIFMPRGQLVGIKISILTGGRQIPLSTSTAIPSS
jgi:hypothetical protein